MEYRSGNHLKKLMKFILKIIVLFLVGYFLIQSGWVETVILPRLNEYFTLLADKVNVVSLDLQQSLPTQSENNISEAPEKDIDSEEAPTPIMIPSTEYRPIPESIDEDLIRSSILQLTNELRVEESLEPLSSNKQLEQAANIRGQETESSFSHTRPDGRDFYTTLNENGLNYSYMIAGENLAMATHHLEDGKMAEFLFNGWVESPGHYENLIKPEYREIGIGVHFDGEILYLVQIFGTPY